MRVSSDFGLPFGLHEKSDVVQPVLFVVQEGVSSGHVSQAVTASAPVEPKQEPEEEAAPWDDITPEDPDAAAAVKQPDDIFGPAHEFD